MMKSKKTVRNIVLGNLIAFCCLPAAQGAFAWKWNNFQAPESIRTEVRNSMNSARDTYNQHAGPVINHTSTVEYNSAVPTADAQYLGRIRFGGSRDGRVAHHEVAHVYGVGTFSQWSGLLRSGNKWGGTIANNRYTGYLPGTTVSTDRQHFWNYGLNQRWEWLARHVWMVRGFRGDMGLTQ